MSADAYINVHAQEGRGRIVLVTGLGDGPFVDPKAEDLVYSEDTTAAGDITLFQKMMSYNSKLSGPGIILTPDLNHFSANSFRDKLDIRRMAIPDPLIDRITMCAFRFIWISFICKGKPDVYPINLNNLFSKSFYRQKLV